MSRISPASSSSAYPRPVNPDRAVAEPTPGSCRTPAQPSRCATYAPRKPKGPNAAASSNVRPGDGGWEARMTRALAATPIPRSAPSPSKLDLLVCVAHPDDEAMYAGGLMARLVDAGRSCKVTLLSHGEGGRLLGEAAEEVKGLTPEEARAVVTRVRDAELAEMAQRLGVDALHLASAEERVDFGWTTSWPESLQRWDSDLDGGVAGLLARLVSRIREEKPRVVLSLDPEDDPHLSGHGHHRASARLTELACRLAALPGVGAGKPHVVEELWTIAPANREGDLALVVDPLVRRHLLEAYPSQFDTLASDPVANRPVERFRLCWRAEGAAPVDDIANTSALASLTEVDRSPKGLAQRALRRLEAVASAGTGLDASDEALVAELQQTFGRDEVTLPHPERFNEPLTLDARLSVEGLSTAESASLLADTLRAWVAADGYRPARVKLGALELPVHNREIAERLSTDYSPESFSALFRRCQEQGTFEMAMDPATGIARTTQIAPGEDAIMSQGWITDAVRFGDVQRDTHPEAWPRVLETLAGVYQKQRAELEEVIANPDEYRRPGSKMGVHHMFNPQTLEAYPWLFAKRLESHALAMEALCLGVRAGMADGASWGLSQASDEVVETIGGLARMFDAIDYPTAPSNGIWEELTFQGGLTWDTEVTRRAFVALRDLLFAPSLSGVPGMADVRARLRGALGERLSQRDALDDLIARGEAKVRERLNREDPQESEGRGIDASMPFAASSSVRLADTPLDDVRAHVRVLEYVEEKLLRENGVLKYPTFGIALDDGTTRPTFDSYLVPGWGLMADSEGRLSLHKQRFEAEMGFPINHLEPSSPERFWTRSAYTVEGKGAEWSFPLSELARGWVNQWDALQDLVEREGETPETTALLAHVRAKATEAINRSYAQVTDGSSGVKANGKPCPAWAVPEAYQYVPTFRTSSWMGPDGRPEREHVAMPGVNSPLGWSAATLYAASKGFLRALEREQDRAQSRGNPGG